MADDTRGAGAFRGGGRVLTMAKARNNLILFGFDLAQIPKFLRQGWSEALQWPFFVRLLPPKPVRVRYANGSKGIWPANADSSACVASAIVLPENLLLRRTLPMPSLAALARQEAIELALAGASPFPPDKTAWGWQARPTASGVEVELVIASREHVDDFLSHAVNSNYLSGVEVWAMTAAGDAPIVLQGYGEGRRMMQTRRSYWKIGALTTLAVFLFLALLASPVLRKQLDVSDLETRLDAAGQEVASALADRNALAQASARMSAMAAYADGHPDPRALLGRLSILLPDTVHLTRLELHGRNATIAGMASNAAKIMEILSAQPGFHDVRAPAAITRDPLSGQESFSIEFRFSDDASPKSGAGQAGTDAS
ncbi:MAG: PilN domain-containing protein [Azoarcus sp.]|jgi:general secretion pathway protein L|nr:PilN domain-containing protein [Azoarcus sp.]